MITLTVTVGRDDDTQKVAVCLSAKCEGDNTKLQLGLAHMIESAIKAALVDEAKRQEEVSMIEVKKNSDISKTLSKRFKA